MTREFQKGEIFNEREEESFQKERIFDEGEFSKKERKFS